MKGVTKYGNTNNEYHSRMGTAKYGGSFSYGNGTYSFNFNVTTTTITNNQIYRSVATRDNSNNVFALGGGWFRVGGVEAHSVLFDFDMDWSWLDLSGTGDYISFYGEMLVSKLANKINNAAIKGIVEGEIDITIIQQVRSLSRQFGKADVASAAAVKTTVEIIKEYLQSNDSPHNKNQTKDQTALGGDGNYINIGDTVNYMLVSGIYLGGDTIDQFAPDTLEGKPYFSNNGHVFNN